MTHATVTAGQIWSNRENATQIIVDLVDGTDIHWHTRIYDPNLILNLGVLPADTLHRDYILDGTE